MPGDKENQQLTSVVESIARITNEDITSIQKNKILYDITYMWSVKNKAYIAKQKHALRYRQLTSDLPVGRVGGVMIGVWDSEVQATMYKIGKQ